MEQTSLQLAGGNVPQAQELTQLALFKSPRSESPTNLKRKKNTHLRTGHLTVSLLVRVGFPSPRRKKRKERPAPSSAQKTISMHRYMCVRGGVTAGVKSHVVTLSTPLLDGFKRESAVTPKTPPADIRSAHHPWIQRCCKISSFTTCIGWRALDGHVPMGAAVDKKRKKVGCAMFRPGDHHLLTPSSWFRLQKCREGEYVSAEEAWG